ncbi:phosphatase PAP2 family protein [Candidatus Nomurabacteria bacterium]|nr:phosphatase PAP2 family protein [Candidatus Nomurabacteria bacterium]
MDLIIFFATYLPWILVLFLAARMLREVERGESLRSIGLIFSSFGVTALLIWLLKSLFYFPRPFVINSNLVPLINQVADSSFPSAHAALFMALAVSVWSYRPRWGAVYLVGALLIGVARFLAHIHSSIDLLAGWLLGALVSTCLIGLFSYNGRH